jgi:hypothetical protein
MNQLNALSNRVEYYGMNHYSDYLREQAVKYRELAEKAEEPGIKQEFFELAEVCEEVANKIDDRRASG